MRSIPTTYAGINFRSRLEARWAIIFDAFGWSWQYEPFDLDGYIPDFIVGGSLLLEIKPTTAKDWADCAARRIRAAGWNGPAVVLGSDPKEHPYEAGVTTPGVWVESSAERKYRDPAGLTDHMTWPVAFAECPDCPPPSVSLFVACGQGPSDGWGCLLCEGGQGCYRLPDHFDFSRYWREAGNRVQWRPPG